MRDDLVGRLAPTDTKEPSVDARRVAPTFPRGLEWAVGASWRLLVVAAACVVVGIGLVRLRIIVVPVFVALIAVTLLESPVRWLQRRRWPPLVATLAVFLGAMTLLAAVVVLLGPTLGAEFAQVGNDLDRAETDIRSWLVDGPLGLTPDQIDRYVGSITDYARTNSQAITNGLLVGTTLVLEAVAGGLLALVLTFFFLKDGGRIANWLANQFAETRREKACAVGRRVWGTLKAYVRGTMLVGLVDAVLVGVGLVVIGVPVALPLAALTFLGAFFPMVGATAAGAVAVLVALVTGGVTDAVIVIGLVVAVQQIEGHVLAPVVMSRALQLPPVVVILALSTGAVLGGLLGAFLAVPLTAMAVAATSEIRTQRTAASATRSA